MLDDGILRVGGRLRRTSMLEERKHGGRNHMLSQVKQYNGLQVLTLQQERLSLTV